jgi:hypothetical protein
VKPHLCPYVDLLSKDLTPLFNEWRDKVGTAAASNKLKTATQTAIDSFQK